MLNVAKANIQCTSSLIPEPKGYRSRHESMQRCIAPYEENISFFI